MFRIFALILFCLPISLSFADETGTPDANQTDLHPSFPLIGKGVMQKHSTSWIGLKCQSQNEKVDDIRLCQSFRHVYFNAEMDTLEEIGPVFENDGYLDERLKRVGENFRVYLNQTTKRGQTRALSLMGGAALAFIIPAGLSVGEHPVISSKLAGALETLVAVPIMFIFVPTVGNDPTIGVTQATQISHPLQDQNGWNWAIRPKKIRRKIFQQYIRYLHLLKPDGSISLLR